MLRLLKLINKNYLKKKNITLHSLKRSYSVNVKCERINHEGIDSLSDKFQKGTVLHGFMVDEIAKIDEIYLTAIRLTHLSTGAQYVHLARDDSNNVFGVAFRTLPKDSTGVPHILEHTTLCGSEKYPCKDPFFQMLSRSLVTFMNALTAPDYTMYPFSTQNLKDYRNLQSVYLDSVFKPNLRELDFCQEGWRLEHTDVNDQNSPIIFKGVVFNEMKGVFNENQTILAQKYFNSILPSHTYAHVSGGDPLVIPTLKHSDLLNFYNTYYHPSNARFYSYGNFPLEGHLEFINDQYLSSSNKTDTPVPLVPSEKRWDKPKHEHIFCRPDPMIADPSRNGSIAIGFLCNDITDLQLSFEMAVLAKLLLDGPNSPFYKSLIESNISTGYGSSTGYESERKDTMFTVSLQGVKPEDFSKVEQIFDETLQKVIEEGFEQNQIEVVLHGVELGVKHQSSNFGLGILFKIMSLWNHDCDIKQSLRINELVTKFLDKMKNNPNYLQDLVQKYLINNNHRLTVTMSPDEKYDDKKAVAEQELLKTKLNELSKEKLDQIYEQGQMLLKEKEKKDNKDLLPTLKIEDLKEDVTRYQLLNVNVSGVPLQVTVQPTNGISYYRGIINTQRLPQELKDLLPLFTSIIDKMATNNYDYRSFDQMIQLKTGGLNFDTHVAQHKSNVMQYEEGIMIESYCLDRNINDMWGLWLELFNNVKLDDLQRFETLVKTNAAYLVSGIANQGHHYASTIASSLVSPVANLKENYSGLQFIKRMKNIAQLDDLTPILNQMNEIAGYVLNKKHLRSALNFSNENKEHILRSINSFYKSLKDDIKEPYIITTATDDNDNNSKQNAIHYVLPYTVNYSSKAILTVPYVDPEYAKLRILSKLLTSLYLHPEIREKAGAYGGGAYLTTSGTFTFYSYRDPNSTKTFDIFDKSYEFFQNYKLSDKEIDEAKLAVFQQIDAPLSPSQRGLLKFTNKITDNDIQVQREQLKSVNKEQIMEVVDKFLKPEQKGIKIGRALLGPQNNDLSQRQMENWTIYNN
ncbi:PREDICTED: presequence protease, mitochondrial [Polistes dominula]|uniref:Presequence protease, mitochondrial n=1 Tax=Polistes dominula TaxID=743375 RepID=A0ABM1JAF3_POLDO|nr:PREDICTED: presequence protease, mitochondrial [Polistes dominula]